MWDEGFEERGRNEGLGIRNKGEGCSRREGEGGEIRD